MFAVHFCTNRVKGLGRCYASQRALLRVIPTHGCYDKISSNLSIKAIFWDLTRIRKNGFVKSFHSLSVKSINICQITQEATSAKPNSLKKKEKERDRERWRWRNGIKKVTGNLPGGEVKV